MNWDTSIHTLNISDEGNVWNTQKGQPNLRKVEFKNGTVPNNDIDESACLVGGFSHPFEKICSSNWIISPGIRGGE